MAKIQPQYALKSLTLILNAAEGTLQILLARPDGRLLCAQDWDAPVRGTEILAPALRQILRGMALTPGHLGRIACVRGPGSFTGIRLILTTAAALRRALNIPAAGLDYMQALALNAGTLFYGHARTGQDSGARQPAATPAPALSAFPRPVWILTHARRALVHCQRFLWIDASTPPRPVSAVELLSPAEAAARIAADSAAFRTVRPAADRGLSPEIAAHTTVVSTGNTSAADSTPGGDTAGLFPASDEKTHAHCGGNCAPPASNEGTHMQQTATSCGGKCVPPAGYSCRPVVAGSGLFRNPEAFTALADIAALVPEMTAPAHTALLTLAFAANYTTQDIEPLYVRPCDAVDNLSQLAGRQGIAPETAHAELHRFLTRPPVPVD